jgi:hypothetical protein
MAGTKRIPLIAALLTFAVHLAANPHYGFYQDELYFIICGFHPDWGYVDQPPLVPLLSAASQLFGHSLFAIRALPAIFAAAGVYVTCLFVVEIGGGAFAQALAALATATMPILMAFGTKVSTDMPGLAIWPAIALVAARIANGGDPRLWLAAGALAGIGSEGKYTTFVFAAAVVAGIALTRLRRALSTPWLLAGIGLGAAIALPSVLWQAAHGFPIVEMVANQQRGVVVIETPWGAMLQQVLVANPLLAPLWILGLAYALAVPRLRWIGLTYLLTVGCIVLSHGRNYYPGDVYPLVIATGALAVEAFVKRPVARGAAVAYVALAAVPTIPFVLPVVPEARLAAIVNSVKSAGKISASPELHRDAEITDNFAGMHGWPELTATVAAVYDGLPPAERAHAAILTKTFAEAAAIDFYGGAYGLPPALSGHNNYWIWGSRGYDGKVVIEVNGECGPMFERARPGVAHADGAWATVAESGVPVSVCYGLREPLAAYWPNLKTYI